MYNVLDKAYLGVRIKTNAKSCSYDLLCVVNCCYYRDCRAQLAVAVEVKMVEFISAISATVKNS